MVARPSQSLVSSLSLILTGIRFGLFFGVGFGLGWGDFWVCSFLCVCTFVLCWGFLLCVFCWWWSKIISSQVSGRLCSLHASCSCMTDTEPTGEKKSCYRLIWEATAPSIHLQMVTAWRTGNRGSCPSGDKKRTACDVTSACPDRKRSISIYFCNG